MHIKWHIHNFLTIFGPFYLPGTTATVLRARRTRNVLNAAKFPIGNAIVIYLHDHIRSNFEYLFHHISGSKNNEA